MGVHPTIKKNEEKKRARGKESQLRIRQVRGSER